MNRSDRIAGFIGKMLILLALAWPLWWIALLIAAVVYPLFERVSSDPNTTALMSVTVGLTPTGYLIAWLFGASLDDIDGGSE